MTLQRAAENARSRVEPQPSDSLQDNQECTGASPAVNAGSGTRFDRRPRLVLGSPTGAGSGAHPETGTATGTSGSSAAPSGVNPRGATGGAVWTANSMGSGIGRIIPRDTHRRLGSSAQTRIGGRTTSAQIRATPTLSATMMPKSLSSGMGDVATTATPAKAVMPETMKARPVRLAVTCMASRGG